MRLEDTIISTTREFEMADSNEPIAVLVDAMPIDDPVVFVPEEEFIEEKVPVNNVLYSYAHKTNGQYDRDGAWWFATRPALICGWVRPREPDANDSYLQDYLAVETDPDGYPIDMTNATPEVRVYKDQRNFDQYRTLDPTIQQQVRYHLGGKCGWDEDWVFASRWGLGHNGGPRSVVIGNCEQCGIAGRLDTKCRDCCGASRVPFLNRAGWVVHPCLVAYFCGHSICDWAQRVEVDRPKVREYRKSGSGGGPTKKPKREPPPMVCLYHWLDFGWCCSRRGSYRNFDEDGHPKYERGMVPKDIALFKMIQEYDTTDFGP